MKKSDLLRLCFIVALWLALCYLLIASQPFSLRIALVIAASAIIVFVPIYKKHKRSKQK